MSAFSLIEAAIVLGVVGLIVGGIWIGASTIREKMLINEMVTSMLNIKSQIATNMPREAMYPSADTYLPVQAMGILPASWTKFNDNLAFAPTGQKIGVKVFAGTAKLHVDMWDGKMTRSQCVNFTKGLMNSVTGWAVVTWSPSGISIDKGDLSTQTLSYIHSACAPTSSGYLFGGNFEFINN